MVFSSGGSGDAPCLTESRGVLVARAMSGSFMTSLEMAGVSLSLMRADGELLRLFGGFKDRKKT